MSLREQVTAALESLDDRQLEVVLSLALELKPPPSVSHTAPKTRPPVPDFDEAPVLDGMSYTFPIDEINDMLAAIDRDMALMSAP